MCTYQDGFTRGLTTVRRSLQTAWYGYLPLRCCREDHSHCAGQKEAARVPVVRVRLVNSVRLFPLQSMMATVELEKGQELDGPLLLEPTQRFSEAEELQFGSSLVYPTENGCAVVMLTNPTGFTHAETEARYVGR